MKFLLAEKMKFDWHLVVAVISSTLLLMVDHYHALTSHKYIDRMILYLAVPLLIIIFLFRENPRFYGFTFGKWKLGLTYTAAGIILMAPVIFLLGRGDASMRTYYGGLVSGLPWKTFLDLIGWEFFFRGWLLFVFARKMGHDALWLQAIPFALAHLGKPELETLSTIFGGFAFGWVAYQTRSFVWPFLIHWFIATFIILVAAGVI